VKILFALPLALILSCQDTQSIKTGNYRVELLFEHDGCKVYRFQDGTTHYYAKCAASTSSAEK